MVCDDPDRWQDKQIRLKVGRYPQLGLADARYRAREVTITVTGAVGDLSRFPQAIRRQSSCPDRHGDRDGHKRHHFNRHRPFGRGCRSRKPGVARTGEVEGTTYGI